MKAEPAAKHPLLRRGAAIVALAAPPGAVVVIVSYMTKPWTIVLGLALVVAGSVALWFALTRRGVRRLVGVLLAVTTLAGLVVVVLSQWRGPLGFVALAVLVSLFGVAASYALAGEHTGAPEAVARAHPVGPAGKGVLIMNLKSGGGKAERFELAEEARHRGIEPVVLEPGDDLLELAENAVAAGADVIGMAGGDGSQALVASVAMKHDVAHVCVPAGTRNHFALDLGLDRNDVVGALDAFDEGVERRIDLARVNDRVFVNNASLGVYAKVVQSDAYRDAKLATWTDMLPELLGPDAAPSPLEFAGPDGDPFGDAPLVLVSNNPYELTHLAGAGTRVRVDSGTLGIVAVRIRTSADVAAFVTLQTVGQVSRFPGLSEWEAGEFEVRSEEPVEVGLDGEALVLEPPLRFVSLPGALRVRLPRNAPGLSPAARAVALTPSNVGLLLAVAAGRPVDTVD